MRQSQKEAAVKRLMTDRAAERREALVIVRETDMEFGGDELGAGFRSGRRHPPSSRG